MLRQLLDRPDAKLIRDVVATIKGVLFLVSLVVGAITLVYVAWARGLLTAPWLILTLIAIIVCLLCLIANLVGNPSGTALRSYRVVEIASTLRVEPAGSHRRYVWTRRLRVRALTDNVRLVDFRWNWTGRSSPDRQTATPLDSGHILFDSRLPENDLYVYQWLYLGRPMRRYEELDVGVMTTIEDDLEPMRPFFYVARRLYSSGRPRSIKVVLEFARSIEPLKVEAAAWVNEKGTPEELPMPARTVDASDDVVRFALDVVGPSPKKQYGFRWTWP